MPILRPSSSLCCLFPTFAPPPLSRTSRRLTCINMQINILQAGSYFAMCTADAVYTRHSWGFAAGVTKMPRSWAVNALRSNCDRTGPSSAEDPAATVLVPAVPLHELPHGCSHSCYVLHLSHLCTDGAGLWIVIVTCIDTSSPQLSSIELQEPSMNAKHHNRPVPYERKPNVRDTTVLPCVLY